MSDRFTFTHCMACQGQAWRDLDGEVFCPTCEDRQTRLQAALAGIRTPHFRTLKAALLGQTQLAFPVFAGV